MALDEVVLKNGRRYLGTIISHTSELIVLEIEGGTVGFPLSMVASPAFRGAPVVSSSEGSETESDPADPQAVISNHPLPGVPGALHKLSGFSWVGNIRQIPVLVTDQGRWQFVPVVSFWAGEFFQLSIFGDPARPTAIEVSLHHPQPTDWEPKRKLLEYVLSLVPGLALDNRFDGLDVKGDQFAIGDLWFEVTGPDSAKSPGRWVVALIHETSLKSARASPEDLQGISELVTATTLDPNQPRSWQRGSWMPDELAWIQPTPDTTGAAGSSETGPASRSVAFTALGGERVFVRSYTRERDRYVRAAADWSRAFTPQRP